MALVDSTLQTGLNTIFNSMKTIKNGGDKYLSSNMASAIKSFVLTAQVSTTDSGTVSGMGSYAGNGTGNPGCFVIDAETLDDDLYDVFTKEDSTDDDFADGMADCIDKACSKQNIITTSTSGTVTPQTGSPIPGYTGTGKGTFTGSKITISNALKSTFSSMRTMRSGGDAIFAQYMASAVGNYLRAGTVNVVLDAPIIGGGSGGVS